MAARSISTTSSDTDLIALLPKEPPKALLDKVAKEKAANQNFIVYKMGWVKDPLGGPSIKAARAVCTACKKVFYLDFAVSDGCHGRRYGFIHPETNEEIWDRGHCLCPNCAAEVQVFHTSAFSKGEARGFQYFFPMSFHRIGREFALCSWRVGYYLSKEGEIHREINLHEAYYTCGKKLKKAVGYWTYFTATHWMDHWEEKKRCDDTFWNARIYLKPKQKDLDGTMLENSKFCEYMSGQGERYPINYIRLYQKHKNIENLITAGLGKVINEMIYKHGASYYNRCGCKDLLMIDWKKKKPHEMLHMSKMDLSVFKEKVEPQCADRVLEILQKAKECGRVLSVEDAALMELFGIYDAKALLEREDGPMRTIRYLQKQRLKYRDECVNLRELLDYWGFAERLGDDLSDRAIKWPQHLKAAHDQAHKRLDEEKQAILNKEFLRRFKALSEYSWEKDGMIIRPAKSQEELRKEGKALSHCVSTYADSHAQGKTAIFFIREAEHPKKAFFTLELDEKSLTVRQNRGKHNCARTEAVQKFEDQWIEHIRRMKNGRKQNTTARIGA